MLVRLLYLKWDNLRVRLRIRDILSVSHATTEQKFHPVVNPSGATLLKHSF